MAGPSAVSINRAVPGVSVRVVMQTGCGPYAYVVVDFEPPGPDGGQEFLYTVPDARLPHEFLPAVWEGIREGLGAVAATVLLTDGGFHEVDSRDYGYWLAGREAGRAALAASGLGPPPQDQGRQIRVNWPGKPRPKPKEGA
ncbi:hypothetical protein OG429_26280 [Streptomyces sp. NBC_00190]|uniref:hypothetical protein n=1 Tax=Streptomyces sp. NBC_00190 TaxID=2903634 RepID=UPI002E28906C|nr:hypothetical protein [Streptomyces sp. NBC_00190]